MPYVFNPFTGELDAVGSGTGSGSVPQYVDADPASPSPGDLWVRDDTAPLGGGEIKAFAGLGFPLVRPAGALSHAYRLSYRTSEGTTVRTNLT